MNATVSWKHTMLILCLTFFLWWSLQWISPVYAGESDTVGTDTILVKFTPGTTTAQRDIIVTQMNGELLRWIAPLHTAEIRILPTERSMASTRTAVAQIGNVISVEANDFVAGVPVEEETVAAGRNPAFTQSTIPPQFITVNDPDFNDPQRVYSPSLLEVSSAWQYTMGSPSVVIAVVDSGVNAAHPDLIDRVLPGYDFVNDDNDATDDQGHGTHISGIIAATANNGVGSAGICPLCSILPVKVLDAANSGTWSNVAAGIVYAVDQGADLINLSLGGTSNPQIVHDAVAYAMQHNVLVIAAAGNSRTDTPFYPAALEDVFAVSATRQDDTRWSLSNYGSWVDIAAPGYTIYSTYFDLDNYYAGYIFMSGTSMAAPHVTGLAGLLLAQKTERTPAELRRLISLSAEDLGEPGPDAEFGAGRIDALHALMLEAPQPARDATLGGIVWQDENENGALDSTEVTGGHNITIFVFNQGGDLVAETVVDGSSDWQVTDLFPGSYVVRAKANGCTILTTDDEYSVQLAESQTLINLNFGIAEVEEEQVGNVPNGVYIPFVHR